MGHVGTTGITPLRVGVLTSWQVPCGVYQYSSRYAEALARREDVHPVVLAARADAHRSTPPEWDGELCSVAKIGCWRDDQVYDLRTDVIARLGLDAIHVQYEQMLFNSEQLAGLCAGFDGPKAITYHDNCIPPSLQWQSFDLHYAHRWNIGPSDQVQVVPFGIEDRPPIVRTFGLGRTRWDYIAPICERHGWAFESAASHEPIQGGGQRWMSHDDLISWLRGADLLVLWYDENGMAGSSQAARTAMAARRPLITNDTTWFEELPTRTSHYQKVSTLQQLETEMCALLADPYVSENSWDRVVDQFVEGYQRCLEQRVVVS